MKTKLLLFLAFIFTNLNAQTELIKNGNFSNGDKDWYISGDFHANNKFSRYHSAGGYAYVADANGNGKDKANGILKQMVHLPSNTKTATLSFYHYISSNEIEFKVFDKLYVTLNSSSSLTKQLVLLSNKNATNSYVKVSYKIPAQFYGKDFWVQFRADHDGRKTTVFRIDDVSLKITKKVDNAKKLPEIKLYSQDVTNATKKLYVNKRSTFNFAIRNEGNKDTDGKGKLTIYLSESKSRFDKKLKSYTIRDLEIGEKRTKSFRFTPDEDEIKYKYLLAFVEYNESEGGKGLKDNLLIIPIEIIGKEKTPVVNLVALDAKLTSNMKEIEPGDRVYFEFKYQNRSNSRVGSHNLKIYYIDSKYGGGSLHFFDIITKGGNSIFDKVVDRVSGLRKNETKRFKSYFIMPKLSSSNIQNGFMFIINPDKYIGESQYDDNYKILKLKKNSSSGGDVVLPDDFTITYPVCGTKLTYKSTGFMEKILKIEMGKMKGYEAIKVELLRDDKTSEWFKVKATPVSKNEIKWSANINTLEGYDEKGYLYNKIRITLYANGDEISKETDYFPIGEEVKCGEKNDTFHAYWPFYRHYKDTDFNGYNECSYWENAKITIFASKRKLGYFPRWRVSNDHYKDKGETSPWVRGNGTLHHSGNGCYAQDWNFSQDEFLRIVAGTAEDCGMRVYSPFENGIIRYIFNVNKTNHDGSPGHYKNNYKGKCNIGKLTCVLIEEKKEINQKFTYVLMILHMNSINSELKVDDKPITKNTWIGDVGTNGAEGKDGTKSTHAHITMYKFDLTDETQETAYDNFIEGGYSSKPREAEVDKYGISINTEEEVSPSTPCGKKALYPYSIPFFFDASMMDESFIGNSPQPFPEKEKSQALDIFVYPNPANTTFRFGVDNWDKEVNNLSVSLLNNTGQVVLHKEIGEDDTNELNIAHLPNGFYYVKITMDGYTGITKLIKGSE